MSTWSHIQNFSIKNFVFWVQSYLDFADIRNLQKSHSHTFAWSAGSNIKLSSDHNLPLHFTFGGLFFTFGGLFTLLRDLLNFWGTFYTARYHKFIKKFMKATFPKKSDHSLTESCYVTITINWGHARKYLKSCLSVYFPSFCASWVID